MVIPRWQRQLADRANTGLSAKSLIFAVKYKAAMPCNGAENAQQWHLGTAKAQPVLC